jgi:hypothetical protein
VEGYGGEELVVEEDGEMSDNDSVDTNPNSWTNRLVLTPLAWLGLNMTKMFMI